MSLCPMSWKNIKKLSAETGITFVHASAHHNHDVLAVDTTGNGWWLHREKGRVAEVQPDTTANTTTGSWLQGNEHTRISEEWAEELRARLAEIASNNRAMT